MNCRLISGLNGVNNITMLLMFYFAMESQLLSAHINSHNITVRRLNKYFAGSLFNSAV